MRRILMLSAIVTSIAAATAIAPTPAEAHKPKVICKVKTTCFGHGRKRHCKVVRVCRPVHRHH